MRNRLPFLLLVAAALVALPVLALEGEPPTPAAQPHQVPSAAKAPMKPLVSIPDLTCAIEVYDLDHNGVPVQKGSHTAQAMNFRVEISATLRGTEPVNNVKLTYNWSLGGSWKRPTNDPWTHTFPTIAKGSTVDAPPFDINTEGGTTSMTVKIVGTIDAAGTVTERNELNNICSFEFTRQFAY